MNTTDDHGESGTAGTSSGTRPIAEHAREIRRDASALAEDLRDTRQELESAFGEEFTQHPLRTVGIALGVGYVLGGGLTTRLTFSMLGAATRLTTLLMLSREVYELSRRWQPEGESGGRERGESGEQPSQYSGIGGGSTMGAGSYQGPTSGQPTGRTAAGGSRDREQREQDEEFGGAAPPTETHH